MSQPYSLRKEGAVARLRLYVRVLVEAERARGPAEQLGLRHRQLAIRRGQVDQRIQHLVA